MDLSDIPLFTLADQRLAWVDARQSLLAQNIANSDTPHWQSHDLKPFAAALSQASVELVRTDPGHLAPLHSSAFGAAAQVAERSPDGNGVAIDKELVKIADTDTAHELVTNLSKKYLGLVQHRDRAVAAAAGDSDMDLSRALDISAAGMAVQTTRLRVVAENLANQDTTGSMPGATPYRRKTVSFANRMDRALGVETVQVARVGHDQSDFPMRFDPSHPAADAKGYVRTPNVNSFIEVMDMREAERSYNANLAVMQSTRGMLERTIDFLKP